MFRNANDAQKDKRMTCIFLLCIKKKTTHKSLKVAAAKSLFSSVYVIGTTGLDACFSFYVIAKRHYLSWKFIVPLRLFWAPFCYFLWDQYFERALYFIRYLNNENMMLMPKFQNKADWLYFFNSSRFFLTNKFFLYKWHFSL